MSKILDIVHVLRNGKPLYGDYVRNRHCIVASESKVRERHTVFRYLYTEQEPMCFLNRYFKKTAV